MRTRLAMIGFVGVALALGAAPRRAAADELDRYACGVRMDFDSLIEYLRPEIERQIAGSPVAMNIVSMEIIPHLHGLTYDSSDRPVRLPQDAPQLGTGTSNDDYVELKVKMTALGQVFYIHIAAAFPTDPPPGIDPVDGNTCTCRTFGDDVPYLIAELPRCDANSEEMNCLEFNRVTWDFVNYPGATQVPGSGIARYQADRLSPPGPSARYPDGCSFVQTLRCSDLDTVQQQQLGLVNPEDDLCVLCQRHWELQYKLYGILPPCTDHDAIECEVMGWGYFDFSFYPTSNTGDGAGLSQFYYDSAHSADPKADLPRGCTEFRYDLCSRVQSFYPEASAALGMDSAPGDHLCIYCTSEWWREREVTVRESDFPGPLAVDLWTSGVPWIFSPDARDALKRIGLLTYQENGVSYRNTCCLQETLEDQIGGAFAPITIPGLDPIDLRRLIWESGGVAISDYHDAIYFKIPGVYNSGSFSCTDPGGHSNNLIGTAMGIWLSQAIDFPKVANMYMRTNLIARQMNLGVTCNHDKPATQVPCQDANGDEWCDCRERGITDVDGDGFCDDEDYCPHVATGFNCETDGDGKGDPHPYFWRNCLDFPSNLLPGYDIDQAFPNGQAREAARQWFCGGCDNCPEVYNPTVHTNAYPQGYVPLLGWPWMNAGVEMSSRQLDRDRDGIGDACDDDADNDGVHREFDCDDLNPTLAHDLDGDGVCDAYYNAPGSDPPDVQLFLLCITDCYRNDLWFHTFDKEACLDRCQFADNCMTTTSQFCANIRLCTSTAAAAQEASCNTTFCEFVRGPGFDGNDQWSSRGNACIPRQMQYCAQVYANADQAKQPGLQSDAPGDKCTVQPRATNLYFGESNSFSPLWCSGSPVVSFRTVGGEAVLDHTENSLRVPRFTTVERDGVNVGACQCVYSTNGSWDPRCSNPIYSQCLESSEKRSDESRVWNPINSPNTLNGHAVINPDYPVTTDPSMDPQIRTEVESRGLVHGRVLGFSHDPGHHWSELNWLSRTTPKFYDFNTTIDWNDAALAKTKIRVAWPPYSRDLNPDTNEVLHSQVGPTSGDCGLFGNLGRALLDRVLQTDSMTDPGHHLFERERAVVVLPGVPEAALRGSSLDAISPGRPGYFVGHSAETGALHLYALGSDSPKVVGLWELDTEGRIDEPLALSGSAGTVSGHLIGQGAERVQAVFLYQGPVMTDVGSGDTGAGEVTTKPSILHVTSESHSDALELRSAAELGWEPSPDVYGAQVVLASKQAALLLIGTESSAGGASQIWRMRLSDGSWEGPVPLDREGGLEQTAARYDPESGKIFVFGGRWLSGADSAAVHTIDPESLAVRPFATYGPAPTLARSDAGMYLDARERALFVYGGRQSDEIITHRDVWRLDLGSRRWTLLYETDLAEAPVPVVAPYLYHDRRRGQVWVADLLGGDTDEGLQAWALDRAGVWHASEAFRLPQAADWPVQARYAPGTNPTYFLTAPAETAWPGALLLAELMAERPLLGLQVLDPGGQVIGTSEDVGAGAQVAAFLCPPGEVCSLQVGLLPEGGGADWTAYTLSVHPATLAYTSATFVPGKAVDLELVRDTVYVVSTAGLRAYRADAGLTEVGSLGGLAAAAGTGLTPCAGHLCLSRIGLRGLRVVDVSNPSAPAILGSAFTPGLSWDVAARGSTAFVAHGIFGVGLYDLSGPASPAWQDQLCGIGRVISVATHGDLLAAAEADGTVRLFDVSGAPESKGELTATGKLSRVRFVNGRLWVLSKRADRVEVFDIFDPNVPVKLGEFTADALKLFHARFRGITAFSVTDHTLEALDVLLVP